MGPRARTARRWDRGARGGTDDRSRAHLARVHRQVRQLRARPQALIEALRRLADNEPELARRLRARRRGTSHRRAGLHTDVAPAKITVLGNTRAPGRWRSSDAAAALLLIASPSRSPREPEAVRVPCRRRPILALAAGTEAGRIVAETGGPDGALGRPPGDRRGAAPRPRGNTEAPDPTRLRECSYPRSPSGWLARWRARSATRSA